MLPGFPPPAIHPMLVHFPLALLPLAALAATMAAWRGERAAWAWTRPAMLWLLGLGFAALLVTIPAGLYDEHRPAAEAAPQEVRDMIVTHEILGFVTAGIFLVPTAWALWRRHDILARGPSWFLVVAMWLGVVLLNITAAWGGSLVFEHGVNVRP